MTIRGCSCGTEPGNRHARRCSVRRCTTRTGKTLFKRYGFMKGSLKRGWK
jgi:hypothetical protein